MATTSYSYGNNPPVTSPRSKGRDARSNIPCRNLVQYGYCRNEKDGCLFNHSGEVSKPRSNNVRSESAVVTPKSLNVDSPAFTPGGANGASATPSLAKKAFSPQAVSAAAFVPRSSSKTGYSDSPPSYRSQSQHDSPSWRHREIPEFVPQSFNTQHDTTPQAQGTPSAAALAEPFNPYSEQHAFNGLEASTASHQINPYSNDGGVAAGLPYYQQQTHLAPLQHHLYAHIGPRREDLEPYQRNAHDFFISEDLRQDLQRKADATLQTLPNSSLPARVDDFHSLVPLDTNTQKASQTLGWKTWVYKAIRGRDGGAYMLRRIEGFRVSTESMIAPIRAWERINNGSIVNIRGCFTTREFGDSSLVIFTDYHPCAKTLAEHHFPYVGTQRGRPYAGFVHEQVLWSYIVQLANALKAIHAQGLAARTVSPTKVLLTGKNRVRLHGVGVIEVVQPDDPRSTVQLQEEDMQKLGQLIFALSSGPGAPPATSRVFETMSRTYSPKLRECVATLIESPPTVDAFLMSIMDQTMSMINGVLTLEDELTGNLVRELENGRLVRLMTKLGFVNERQEYNSSTPEHIQWSETGDRYYLKLFRDYVFHQVSSDGRPVLDLGHVISCLNKLDAGVEEKIALITRDEQHIFVVTFKEIKKGLDAAFQDLARVQRRA